MSPPTLYAQDGLKPQSYNLKPLVQTMKLISHTLTITQKSYF